MEPALDGAPSHHGATGAILPNGLGESGATLASGFLPPLLARAIHVAAATAQREPQAEGPWMPQDHPVSLAAGIRARASNDSLRSQLLSPRRRVFLFAGRAAHGPG